MVIIDPASIASTLRNIGATGIASGRLSDVLKLPGQDSNLDKENQNLLCYRYTTG